MITPDSVLKLSTFHSSQNAAMTLLSADLDDPTGYGRVIRKSAKGSEVRAIVEEKAASAKQRKIVRSTRGSTRFQCRLFMDILASSPRIRSSRYYLTDMAAVFSASAQESRGHENACACGSACSNRRSEIVDLDGRMRLAKCHQLMKKA